MDPIVESYQLLTEAQQIEIDKLKRKLSENESLMSTIFRDASEALVAISTDHVDLARHKISLIIAELPEVIK